MPIQAADIQYLLSGGGANTDADASLGGAISSQTISSGGLHNLFDKVIGDESSAGDTEYRCFYVKNNHGSITWESVKAWIATQTPSADTRVEIGLDPAGVNAEATTIADESTAPGGVTFSTPTTKTAGLAIGNVPAGQYQAIWVKRVVDAGAAAANNDGPTLRCEGDTAA